ncbi:MAG: YdcF family protein [Armatimonadota bacterium]|nr:YdcF family protein [Armatimonadota bacterium]
MARSRSPMRRGFRLLLTVAGVIVLAAVALSGAVALGLHRPVLTAVGRFLVVEDPLERADAIVVLSGGRRDERVRQGADLYKAGYAPLVVLSGGEQWAGAPIADLLRHQALAHGIPARALRIESRSTSTAEQARYLRPMLEALGIRRAIVVTSSYHTRRTRYLFRKAFAGSSVEVRIYPVQRDLFDPGQWWRRAQDTESVVLEYIKLALAVLR